MRALSIRQPYAELILRGIKTVEYRSRPTRIIAEPFYIYASCTRGEAAGFERLGCTPGQLPTGLLVGTARISKCVRHNGKYHWYLAAAKRLPRPRKPKRHPQPVWFKPF